MIRAFVNRLTLLLAAVASAAAFTLHMPAANAEPSPSPSPTPSANDSALAQAIALNDPAKQEGIPSTKKADTTSSAGSCDEFKPGSPKLAKVPEGKNVVCIASQGPASEISPRLANALPRPAEIPEWCQDATHWEFNRTQACRHWVYNVLMIDTRGKVIGTLELDTWDMVVTTPNAERMTWEQWLHPQFPTGGPWTGMTWTANGDCVGLCAMQTTNVTVPVDFGARWTRAYHWFVDTLGSTIGQKAKISLDVEHVFYVPGTFPVDMSDAVQLVEDIRCDYRSAGTNAYHGCVFPGYRPIMRVPKTTMPQFAQHIADAQSTNWPIGAPGNVPLSRLTNKADIKENRTQSCQYAPSPRPPDPATGERQECDEYPFASTHEGSYTSGFDASWRLIRESQNLAGANLLQSTYDQNRILNKDEFWVQVVTI